MPPSLNVSEWWENDARKGTPVVVTMENPNYSLVEIDSPEDDAMGFQSMEKDRGKNAKQFTWVLLLKAHRAAGCVTWLATGLWALLGAIKKRVALHPGAASLEIDRPSKGKLLFKFLRGFLLLSLVALAFEIVAYWNGWHFQKSNLPNLHIPETAVIRGWMHSAYLSWLAFRADYIAYPIKALSNFCVILFVIQSIDRMVLCLGCFWIKLKKIKPRIEDPFKADVEEGYPMVLIQIPMCNEREVMQLILPCFGF